jgi:hypothetical protein
MPYLAAVTSSPRPSPRPRSPVLHHVHSTTSAPFLDRLKPRFGWLIPSPHLTASETSTLDSLSPSPPPSPLALPCELSLSAGAGALLSRSSELPTDLTSFLLFPSQHHHQESKLSLVAPVPRDSGGRRRVTRAGRKKKGPRVVKQARELALGEHVVACGFPCREDVLC